MTITMIADVLGVMLGLAILLVFVGMADWGGDGGLARRLGSLVRAPSATRQVVVSPPTSQRPETRLSRSINARINRFSLGASLAQDLSRADVRMRPSEFIALWIAAVCVTPFPLVALGLVVPTFANPVIWLIGAAIGFIVPRFLLRRRIGARRKAFDRQLADVITMIANSLRSGSSFLQAVDLVARESEPPASIEFSRITREMNLGLSFDAALDHLLGRIRSADLELVVIAVSLQRQVGGNLAGILDTIAKTVRERSRIQGDIRSLTAQQRMSGYLVGGMPVVLIMFLMLIAPDFMRPMFSAPPAVFGVPVGVVMLGFSFFSIAIGFLIIRRIVSIEV